MGAPGFAFTADPSMGILNQAGNAMTHSVNGSPGMTLESGTGTSAGRMVLTIWGNYQ